MDRNLRMLAWQTLCIALRDVIIMALLLRFKCVGKKKNQFTSFYTNEYWKIIFYDFVTFLVTSLAFLKLSRGCHQSGRIFIASYSGSSLLLLKQTFLRCIHSFTIWGCYTNHWARRKGESKKILEDYRGLHVIYAKMDP